MQYDGSVLNIDVKSKQQEYMAVVKEKCPELFILLEKIQQICLRSNYAKPRLSPILCQIDGSYIPLTFSHSLYFGNVAGQLD